MCRRPRPDHAQLEPPDPSPGRSSTSGRRPVAVAVGPREAGVDGHTDRFPHHVVPPPAHFLEPPASRGSRSSPSRPRRSGSVPQAPRAPGIPAEWRSRLALLGTIEELADHRRRPARYRLPGAHGPPRVNPSSAARGHRSGHRPPPGSTAPNLGFCEITRPLLTLRVGAPDLPDPAIGTRERPLRGRQRLSLDVLHGAEAGPVEEHGHAARPRSRSPGRACRRRSGRRSRPSAARVRFVVALGRSCRCRC